jgi:RHS repeat-associated protein
MSASRLFTALAVVVVTCVIARTTAHMRVSHLCSAESNSPPVAIDDNYTVHGSLILKPLLNDGDPDGDPVFFDGIAASPQHGVLVGVNPGELSYTASDSYVGSDSFTYFIRDNCFARASATVNINVVNQAPIANPDSYTVHGSLVLKPPLNDTDPDGDPIIFEGLAIGPQHGTLVGVNPGGEYEYKAAEGYVGSDSFTYKIRDSLFAHATGTVTLNIVNQAPIANPDSYAVRGSLVLKPPENDTDPDRDPIIFAGIATGPQHGTLVGVNPGGQYEYTAAAGYVGSDSFTYTIRDSLFAYATGTVTLYVIGDGENDGLCPCHARAGGPVNVTNGNMYLQQGDYALPSVGPGINVTRTYNSNSQRMGLFGSGWSSEYDESIASYDNNLARLNRPDGRAIYLGRAVGSSGSFAPLEGDFHGSLVQNGGTGATVTTTDGSVRQFNSSGKLIQLSDRIGNQTTLTYDSGGKLASVTDPFGRVLYFTTNANGQVVSISDTMDTVATYTYGGSNQLLSATYADNSGYHFSYDGNNRLTTVSDALGNVVESHTYDGQGRAITSERQGGVEHYSLNYVSDAETDVTDALAHVTKYSIDKSQGRNVVTRVEGLCNCGSGSRSQTWTYDNQLNVISRSNTLNQTTSYTYDAGGNRLTQTDATGTVSFTYNQFAEVLTRTDQLNGVTTNTYDAQGNLLTTKDALNNTTTFTYDARGQLLTMTNALGKVTTLTWDTSGRLTQAKDALNNTTNFTYDARARLTSITNALNFVTSYAYDLAGRVNKITRPNNTFITFTYDLAGRRTKVTDALNNSTSFAYDSAYRLTGQTDALGKSVSYTYDLMSNLTAATDQLAHTTNIDYDEFNRPVKTTYPPAVAGGTRLLEMVEYDAVGNVTKRTDTAGRVTTFAYDNANQLLTVMDPAFQVTQYEYNARSNVTAVVDALGQRYTFDYDALSRVTTATRAGLQMSFAYNAVSNRTGRTDYNNMTTGYNYDALNRLTKITYPDASTVNYGYDKLSQMTSAANINGTVSFVYDNIGRTTSTTDVFGQVLNYTYDANDRRTKLSFGATTNATYAYDVVNRLTKITDSANQVVAFAYDAAGKQTSKTLPNGVAATYTYDGLDRLTGLKDTKGKAVIADNQYSYNNSGDITRNIDQSGTHVYGYDTIDRLTSATYTGTPNETYAYDGVGNRTSSHKSATYSYQPFNRLTNSATASYLYNNSGNMISKSDAGGTTQFVWDFENRLTQIVTPSSGSVSYKYDGLGRRIQRTPSSGVSTNFIYDGQDVVKDINSDGTTVEYLNGPSIDNKIRQKGSSNSTTYYFSQDHLGSTTALTGTTGKLIERQTYDAYGNSTGSTRTRYGYTGRERDALTSLLYYRARFYDPQLGRFISEDPIGLTGGINSFAYVSNNPQNATDPSGLYDIDVHYYLTYYLALRTGCFSDAVARTIAEGDQRSDQDRDKKPGWGNKITTGPTGYPMIVPDAPQRRRNVLFHSFGTAAQNGARQAELVQLASAGGGDLFGFGTYLHFLQDSFSHRAFAGNDTWGQATGGEAVDHTNNDAIKAMEMAHSTFGALREFGKRRGCRCDGDADWKVVQEFIDVGWDHSNPAAAVADFAWHVTDAQLRRKIEILKVPWRSPNGR